MQILSFDTDKFYVVGELSNSGYNSHSGKMEADFYPSDCANITGKVPKMLAEYVISDLVNPSDHDYIIQYANDKITPAKFIISDRLNGTKRYFNIVTIN